MWKEKRLSLVEQRCRVLRNLQLLWPRLSGAYCFYSTSSWKLVRQCRNVSLEQSPCNGKGQRSLLTLLNMCLTLRYQERSVSFLPLTNILKSSKWKDNKNLLLSLLIRVTNNYSVVTIMKVLKLSVSNHTQMLPSGERKLKEEHVREYELLSQNGPSYKSIIYFRGN